METCHCFVDVTAIKVLMGLIDNHKFKDVIKLSLVLSTSPDAKSCSQ